MRDRSRTCSHCACILASDDRSPVCSPCRLQYRRRRRDGYRPQHDAALRQRLLETLQEHRGERINVYRVMGMWPCGLDEWVTVKAHIRWLQRHGHTVFGWHDGTYQYISGPPQPARLSIDEIAAVFDVDPEGLRRITTEYQEARAQANDERRAYIAWVRRLVVGIGSGS